MKAENTALATDNAQLESRLAAFGIAPNTTSPPSAISTMTKNKADSGKRRKISQNKTTRLIGDACAFSILLMCAMFALIHLDDDALDLDESHAPADNSQYLNAQKMSMSMGRGIRSLTKENCKPPLFTSFVCVISLVAGVLALWRHKSTAETGHATRDNMPGIFQRKNSAKYLQHKLWTFSFLFFFYHLLRARVVLKFPHPLCSGSVHNQLFNTLSTRPLCYVPSRFSRKGRTDPR